MICVLSFQLVLNVLGLGCFSQAHRFERTRLVTCYWPSGSLFMALLRLPS